MKDVIIQELRAQRTAGAKDDSYEEGRNDGLTAAIAIIRQHQAEQPQDLIERKHCIMRMSKAEFDVAQAAIANMGDVSSAATPVQCRQAFETWFADEIGVPLTAHKTGGYKDSLHNAMWFAWKSAWTSLPKREIGNQYKSTQPGDANFDGAEEYQLYLAHQEESLIINLKAMLKKAYECIAARMAELSELAECDQAYMVQTEMEIRQFITEIEGGES